MTVVAGRVISYKNRYVETETFTIETKLNKPGFLPALAGDAPAIIAAFLLNSLRFGAVNEHMGNTNVFEHSGKVYAIAENYVPQEVDISTLETVCNWDVNGTWDRPFTSHPKICDMVAVARIINATLVIPELDKRSFWKDSSNFSDVFDEDHFINALSNDVKITKKLPKELATGTRAVKHFRSWSGMDYYQDEIASMWEEYEVRFLEYSGRI
ncbi:hypothetical protein ACLB2K_007889 [Fragaria x ananassa]